MRCRKLALLIILIGVYLTVATNNPPEWFKALGYNQVLDIYGRVCAGSAPITWIYNPGLYPEITNKNGDIEALIPDGKHNYQERVLAVLAKSPQAIIECSAIDAWHSTTAGQKTLQHMQRRTYRVVVFDGGHHLPTLGMGPDILLVPVLGDTAVHSYMRDGMKVQVLQHLLEELGSPAVAVTIPRWSVVKSSGNLEIITRRVINGSGYKSPDKTAFHQTCAAAGMSCYNGCVMAYVDEKPLNTPHDYAARLKKISSNIDRVYLAFNYNHIDQMQAESWSKQLSAQLDIPVTVVNQPLKVTDVFLGR